MAKESLTGKVNKILLVVTVPIAALYIGTRISDYLDSIKLVKQQDEYVAPDYPKYDKGKYPKSWEVYHNIGIKLLTQGNYPTAIFYFNKAIKLNPNEDTYTNLATAYNKIGLGEKDNGRHEKAKENFEKVRAYATSAIRINPNFAEAYHVRAGVNSLLEEPLEEVEKDLRTAQQLDPNNPSIQADLEYFLKNIKQEPKTAVR